MTGRSEETAVGDVAAFAAVLLGMTAVAVVWLNLTGVDPAEGFSPAILLAGYAPLVAALVISGLRGGRDRVRGLLSGVLRWRVSWGWYALVLLAPLVMVALTDLAYVGFGPTGATWILPSTAVAGAVVGSAVSGAVGEEIGWRGFAQPTLQRSYSPLTSSLVIGVLWATWHQWPLLAPGGAVVPLDVLAGYLRLTSTAVLYGWLYNATGSLLLVMIAHAGHNLAVSLLPTPDDPTGWWHLGLAVGYVLAALVVAPRMRRAAGDHR